jgi:DHA2 family multidrug resistance protein-like MFS transporter
LALAHAIALAAHWWTLAARKSFAGLCVATMIALVFGMKKIAQDGIGGAALLALLLGGVVGVLFVHRQLNRPDPMLDLRLFRLGTFRIALLINMIGIFVAFGYFLFVAQYFQLVLGLSPLTTGVVMAPSGVGFLVGSQLAPRIVRVVRPAYLIGIGLAVSGIGLLLLTRIGVTGGLALTLAASVIVSLGLAPVFGITTELIVGSAPPEQAGAASGVSETGAELVGALGISILGSISVALYRGDLAESLPADLPAAAGHSTLGAAVQAAATRLGDSATRYCSLRVRRSWTACTSPRPSRALPHWHFR